MNKLIAIYLKIAMYSRIYLQITPILPIGISGEGGTENSSFCEVLLCNL